MQNYEIREYVTPHGKNHFYSWLKSLRDSNDWARIRARLDRFVLAIYGDFKSLGNSIYELRFKFGPGYRIYFARSGKTIILLLCGGDKSSQKKDIKRAREYWNQFRS